MRIWYAFSEFYIVFYSTSSINVFVFVVSTSISQ